MLWKQSNRIVICIGSFNKAAIGASGVLQVAAAAYDHIAKNEEQLRRLGNPELYLAIQDDPRPRRQQS
jgi:hypothetical protein